MERAAEVAPAAALALGQAVGATETDSLEDHAETEPQMESVAGGPSNGCAHPGCADFAHTLSGGVYCARHRVLHSSSSSSSGILRVPAPRAVGVGTAGLAGSKRKGRTATPKRLLTAGSRSQTHMQTQMQAPPVPASQSQSYSTFADDELFSIYASTAGALCRSIDFTREPMYAVALDRNAAADGHTTDLHLKRFLHMCHPVALDITYCLGDGAPRILVMNDKAANHAGAGLVLRMGHARGGKRARVSTASAASAATAATASSAGSGAGPGGGLGAAHQESNIVGALEALSYTLHPGQTRCVFYIDVVVSDRPKEGMTLLQRLTRLKLLCSQDRSVPIVFMLEATTPLLADAYFKAGFTPLTFRGGLSYMVCDYKSEELDYGADDGHALSPFMLPAIDKWRPGRPSLVEMPEWLQNAVSSRQVALNLLLQKLESAWEEHAQFGGPGRAEARSVLSAFAPLVARLECEQVRFARRMGVEPSSCETPWGALKIKRTLKILLARLSSTTFFSPAVVEASALPDTVLESMCADIARETHALLAGCM